MSEKVYVWDKFIRLFHWSLVGLFLTSYLTGESESPVHIYSGYAISILLIARIFWGFIGSRHARFTDFIYSPRTIVAYARDFFNGKPAHFPGHNPLGGLMVIALLLTLTVTVVSGMKLYAVEEGKGPLAQSPRTLLIPQAHADEDEHDEHAGYGMDGAYEENVGEDFWEELHETAVNLLILLIVVHVLGVIVSSRMHHESLVKAMISGNKERQ